MRTSGVCLTTVGDVTAVLDVTVVLESWIPLHWLRETLLVMANGDLFRVITVHFTTPGIIGLDDLEALR